MLDKAPAPRHDLGVVTRALRFLALLSAFFVVAVRCLGGFPLALACVEAAPSSDVSTQAPTSSACPESPASDDDTLAPVALDDDSDDGADALLTPAPVEVKLQFGAVCSGLACSALAHQRALPSHAPSLERPPRV